MTPWRCVNQAMFSMKVIDAIRLNPSAVPTAYPQDRRSREVPGIEAAGSDRKGHDGDVGGILVWTDVCLFS